MRKIISRIFLAGIVLAPLSALAAPITVDFTITATGSTLAPGADYAGFAAGTTGGGSFTFDDSIGNAYDQVNGLPTIDLSFNWLGYSYTEANATLWEVGFDSTGHLNAWGFAPTIGTTATDCNLNCYAYPGPTDFWMVGYPPEFEAAGYPSFGHFHIEGHDGAMAGNITWAVRDVPEPGTLALLGCGLLGVFATRRRRAV